MRAGGDRAMFFGDYIDAPAYTALPLRARAELHSFAYSDLGRGQHAPTRRPGRVRCATRASARARRWSNSTAATTSPRWPGPSSMLIGFRPRALSRRERADLHRPPLRLAFYNRGDALRRRAGQLHLQHRGSQRPTIRPEEHSVHSWAARSSRFASVMLWQHRR